jgi:cytosine/adenosine deaminase-related metal-dependent hydrolase
VTLSMDSSVWFSHDPFSSMRATLAADRGRQHLEAHAVGETVVHHQLRAREVLGWATIGGARALGLDRRIGSLTPGKQADVVLIKNDRSPAMYPILHPYGHVVLQAGRADVHTVLVNGTVLKYRHELVGVDLARARAAVEASVEYTRTAIGEEAWQEAIEPEIPETGTTPNLYAYAHRGAAPGRSPGR